MIEDGTELNEREGRIKNEDLRTTGNRGELREEVP